MSDSDWSFGTFAGAKQAQRQRLAATTAAQRLSWLDDMLGFARASGVLERVWERKQRAIDKAWYGEAG
jgi:hypothetical protein